MTEQLRRGTVVSVHASAKKYGGSFGEISANDGEVYSWSSGNVYRDGTAMVVGAVVTFIVVAHSYASEISDRAGAK